MPTDYLEDKELGNFLISYLPLPILFYCFILLLC